MYLVGQLKESHHSMYPLYWFEYRVLVQKVTPRTGPPLHLRNKHFELPYDVSPYFTGGDEVRRELRENCFPLEDSSTRTPQKRFVIYGLGGSGKTQMALKFASDHRERYEIVI